MLKVPIIAQRSDFDCLLAGMKMIMDYWKDEVSYKDLIKDLSLWINLKERPHTQGVAIYLTNRGYQVWFVHHDPYVVDKHTDNSTEKDLPRLKKRLGQLHEKNSTDFQRKKIDLDIEYIKAGGKYSNSVPTLVDIDNWLEEKMPVLMVLSRRVWTSNPKDSNNHAVVIIGKDERFYFLNNAIAGWTKPERIPKDRLLMAWYATGAYALTARPKRNGPPTTG